MWPFIWTSTGPKLLLEGLVQQCLNAPSLSNRRPGNLPEHFCPSAVSCAEVCFMTIENVRRLDRLPAMWAVLLYRIHQSEERDQSYVIGRMSFLGLSSDKNEDLESQPCPTCWGPGSLSEHRFDRGRSLLASRLSLLAEPFEVSVFAVWSRDLLVDRQIRTQHIGRRTQPPHDPCL